MAELKTKNLDDFESVEPAETDNLICSRGRVSVGQVLDLAAARAPSYIKIAVQGGAEGEYCYIGVKSKNGVLVLSTFKKSEVEQ